MLSGFSLTLPKGVLLELQVIAPALRMQLKPVLQPLILWVAIRKTGKVKMSAQAQMEPTSKIPSDISTELRRLAHDLSNSLETIMQASYLLSQSKLDETSKRWATLIDSATRDAARINREVREILRSRST